MRKQTLADKLAKLSFNSAGFQKSWQVHMNAFGPILEPAFVEDYQARVHLTNWLNKISQGDAAGSLPLMKKLQKYIETDADRCLYYFCCALCFRSMQVDEQYYDAMEQCVALKPRFYLPYVDLAQQQLFGNFFDEAVENFRAALKYYPENQVNLQNPRTHAVLCCNLAAGLLFLHRQDEARAALEQARKICDTPDVCAVEARFFALAGDAEGVKECVARLNAADAELAERIGQDAEKILRREHPHFFEIPTAPKSIAAFWKWFDQNAAELAASLNSGDPSQAVQSIQEQLHILFPYAEAPLIGEIGSENGMLILRLKHYHSKSLVPGIAQLLAAFPEKYAQTWRFIADH